MADTVYTDYNQSITINSAWLNDINNVVYRLLGTSVGVGGAAPTTVAQLQANLGIATPTNVAASIAAAFASPPALGSTTPAAVNATSGTFSGNVSTAILTPTAIVGRTTAPAAGQIGEEIRVVFSAVAVSSSTSTNLATLPLTAGVWDVTGNAAFQPSTGSVNLFSVWTSQTSATQPSLGLYAQTITAATALVNTLEPPIERVVLGTSGNVYISTLVSFASGTLAVSGFVRAVRVA